MNGVLLALMQVLNVQILDDPVITTHSIEIAWRPPSKNSERISSYKLMAGGWVDAERG